MNYYISKYVDMPFDEAVIRTRQELKNEGFGVLTEIDVKATLKAKINVDFRPYIILGACNPEFAYKALQTSDKVGVLLPCNVIVQQHDDKRVEIVAMDPLSIMQGSVFTDLSDLANAVQIKLRKVLAAI